MKKFLPVDVTGDRLSISATRGLYLAALAEGLSIEEATAVANGSASLPPLALRTDGPTVEQFVSAGYLAKNYPPEGYESRSTAEEIAAAIAAQEAGANTGSGDTDTGAVSDDAGETGDAGSTEPTDGHPSDAELFALIEQATGVRPHHRTGRERLLQLHAESQTKPEAE